MPHIDIILPIDAQMYIHACMHASSAVLELPILAAVDTSGSPPFNSLPLRLATFTKKSDTRVPRLAITQSVFLIEVITAKWKMK